MPNRLTRVASGYALLLAAISCVCPDEPSYVYLKAAAPGEPSRGWRVGDTASVWAEVWNGKYDVQCVRYASRPSPNYDQRVEPDSFTFYSSRPDVATVTNRGLVTGLKVGQTNILATGAGVTGTALTITVQAAAALNTGAPPNKRVKLAARSLRGRIAFVRLLSSVGRLNSGALGWAGRRSLRAFR